ncbi:MAG TPA: zinc ribbon domain-containing protein [Longimicrobiales bacterium]|nr:zinc ribbon domain-containing protein [Longimicrobiales bacterium]
MTEGVLPRFHSALVEALRVRDAEHLGRPFTVAEIYQDLVPYGTHRELLGVEMNGDYEHALLRLLAGEGEYVEIESEAALREIREELDSNNPNTGLYREFAAVDARLNVARIGDAIPLAGRPAAPEADIAPPPNDEENDMDEGSGEPMYDDAEDDAIQNVPLGAFATSGPLDPEMVEESGGGATLSDAPEVCRWCRETLPQRDNLNYCPFCGTDVTLVPCQSCGEALEPTWRFCIACGTEAPSED